MCQTILRSPARFFHVTYPRCRPGSNDSGDEHVAANTWCPGWSSNCMICLPISLSESHVDLVWKTTKHCTLHHANHNTQALGACTEKPPDLPSMGRKSKKLKCSWLTTHSLWHVRHSLPNPPRMAQLATCYSWGTQLPQRPNCGNEYLSHILDGQHPWLVDQFMPSDGTMVMQLWSGKHCPKAAANTQIAESDNDRM